MKFKEYDVIIVGTGVSGLYAALNLDSSMQILMLSKRELTLCNSALAPVSYTHLTLPTKA